MRTRALPTAAVLGLGLLLTACSTPTTDLTSQAAGGAAAAEAAPIDSCDPAETTLTIAFPQQTEPTVAVAREAIQQRHPGLTIEGTAAPTGSYDELTQQVAADIAGGRDIDVVNAGNSQLRFYVDTYQPIPIDPSRLRPTYKTQYLNVGEVDGDLYMVPFQVSVPALYFNQTLMAEAGLDPDAPAATYSEFLDAARKLATVTDTAPATVSPFDWIAQAVIQSASGEYVAADGTAGFDTAAGREGLSIWTSLVDEGLMEPMAQSDEISSFVTGKTAFYVSSSAIASQFTEQIGDAFDWGVAPMPVPDGGSAEFPAGGNSWLSLADEPCEAAFANEFVAELLAPEALMESLRGFSYIPVDTEAQQLLLGDPATSPQQATSYRFDTPVTQWGGWPGAATVEANTLVTEMTLSIVRGTPLDRAIAETTAAIDQAVGD